MRGCIGNRAQGLPRTPGCMATLLRVHRRPRGCIVPGPCASGALLGGAFGPLLLCILIPAGRSGSGAISGPVPRPCPAASDRHGVRPLRAPHLGAAGYVCRVRAHQAGSSSSAQMDRSTMASSAAPAGRGSTRVAMIVPRRSTSPRSPPSPPAATIRAVGARRAIASPGALAAGRFPTPRRSLLPPLLPPACRCLVSSSAITRKVDPPMAVVRVRARLVRVCSRPSPAPSGEARVAG